MMKVICLKGHSKAITSVLFNAEGDLLFTCSLDSRPTVWRTHNGERIGTYEGHSGSVWHCAVNRDSTRLLTASGDQTVRLWDVHTGESLLQIKHKVPVRSVDFSLGEKLFLTVTDSVMKEPALINLFPFASDYTKQVTSPISEIRGDNTKINHAYFGPLNKYIIACFGDGRLKVYDTETRKVLKEINDHTRSVEDIQFDPHKIMFITASKDGTSKLYDARSFEHLKTFETGLPINAAAVSPLTDHVLLVGGQSKDAVAATRVDNSQFKLKFFDIVRQDLIGLCGGHFGTVNTVSYSPDGRFMASGGEDGFIRLIKLDRFYLEEFGRIASTPSHTPTSPDDDITNK